MRHLPLRGAVASCALLASVVTSGSLSAQASFPFPLTSPGGNAIDPATDLPLLVPNPARIADLTAFSEVSLREVALPTGEIVDLSLERIDLDAMQFGYYVDGLAAPGLADGLELSVWTGTVDGDARGEVVLSFSNRGSRGWITTAQGTTHIMPQPGPGGDWSTSYSVLSREGDLAERGVSFKNACGLDAIVDSRDLTPHVVTPGLGDEPSFAGTSPCDLYDFRVAIETDFQLYSLFNDLGAETAYVTTLLAAISARYVEQIDTQWTIPYLQFYTTSNDPWSTPDNGGGSIDMLTEFENAWAGNVPNGAVIGHMISGANLGGGVAYLTALCDSSQTFSFAVSGNIGGDTPFPIAVGPLNWDFMVVAHETGHNFASPHTHDYSPQIDNCAGGSCVSNGTIMSYCHQCAGGLSNVTTYFHPTVVNVMKNHVASCLPFLAPIQANPSTQPVIVMPGATQELTVDVLGTPVGNVNLNYRFDGGGFSTVAMSDQGGGTYAADLPAPDCGDVPEWFFSMNDATCGAYSTENFLAEVGAVTVVFSDDLEGGSGWTSGAAGDDATTGLWVHGNPIGTGAQPEDDNTAIGTDCWFTGQGSGGGSVGENDVDGGTTTLTTSALDLSGGDARIGYERWYSNDGGSAPNADTFVVQVSNGGGYVTVETVGPTGAGTSGGWIHADFLVSDFVAPNANVTVRFIASDLGSGSIIEAAIDDLSVFRIDCDNGTVCQADLGFGGPGSSSLTICGDALSTGNSADMVLSGAATNTTAFVLAGLVNAPTPVKGGVLVPVPWLFELALPTGAGGGFSVPLAGGFGPVSIYVQAAYPDGGLPGGFGFSNAVRADFLP